jgi:hypothetical protein
MAVSFGSGRVGESDGFCQPVDLAASERDRWVRSMIVEA